MAMNDSEKARIAGRKEAVKAGAAKGLSGKESRKRYYVQTRVAELEKAGKPVSAEKRKQLREKFNSGDVSRKGFAAPKKKTGGSGSSGSGSGSSGSTIITQSGGRSARDNMKGVSGYKAGSTKASSKQFGPQLSNVSKVAKKKNSGGVLGALKGAKNFVDNTVMGKADSKRAADYILKGDYKNAAKSAGTAAARLGSFIVGGGTGKAIGMNQTAKLAKAQRIGSVGKSPVRSLLVSGAKTGAKKSGAKVAPKSSVKKVALSAPKRVPKVAKTVSKPLTKKTTKSLTSKAVFRGVAKSGVKKTAANAARKRAANAKYMTGTSK